MSCQGKKGEALKKCLENYRKESKKYFPNFNQKTDTVVSGSSVNSNMSKKISASRGRRATGKGNYGSPSVLLKDNSTGNYITKIKVKKNK